ncbi:MAG: hypothetical protein RL354_868, partial [Planctomycetota bacterium]
MPDWTPDQLNDRTTEDSVRDGAAPWLVALDTGGTFTDLVARDPRGTILRAKVPSDGSILATLLSVDRAPSACRARIRPAAGLVLPDGLLDGWRVEAHADEPTCVRSQRGEWIELSAPLAVEPGRLLRFVRSDAPIDAPRLGLHAITGTPLDRALPPIEIRLSTTRGTNALLEGRGARVGVLVSDGLTGVVEIGDQTREDIFARVPVRTRRVATAVRALPERSRADGQVLHEANPESCAAAARALLGEGCETVVVSLAHALANDRESSIARELRARGVRAIAAREIAPHPRLLTRTETACVHAQIEPVLAAFVNDATCTAPDARSFAFTSAGVLQRATRLLARDTLYSGPAGGARAVATVARRHGFDRAVGFDMGGTSSDVSRCTGDGVALRGESRINRMTVAAPSVAIDSVAAGGGSICRMRDGALEVGPESAGANPGPACYGRGGPLTITDINLLAGRMAVGVGAMSLDPAPAEHALARISDELARTRPSSRDALLQALLDIADARMALAIEALCVRDGVDPRGHALIAFGGAGGQHACAIATRLGIAQVVFPRFAGFMCAQGVFAAEPARFATRTVLATLDNCAATLAGLAAEATAEATHALALDGFPAPERTRVRASLRLSGQEASIEVPFASADDMRARFMERFRALFGYEPPPRAIEVVSLEATAWAAAWAAAPAQAHAAGKSDATSSQDGAPTQSMLSEGERVDARSIARGSLREGDLVLGPAIITDAGETVVLDRGWRATVDGGGDLIASRTAPATARASDAEQELFAARLEAIALSMGNVLERTALSPNIRDRLDFSCAVLDAHGTLVQNAPHLPVHLGALGVCTRAVMSELDLAEGDIAVTNHPAFGGSHLPDVTTVAPVYAGGVRVAFVAVRAHHAEIGGTRPGSFPPDARSLAEEGIVLEPFLAVRGGTFDRVACRARFASGPHPSRNPDENLADLEAQVAATRYGVSQVAALARE